MKYTCINIQGNLISEEILQKVDHAEAAGQLATDFGFEPGSNIRSEIEYAWSRIKLDWKHFGDRFQNLPAGDPYGTTLSRKWMEQFLGTLGFDLSRQRTSLVGDNNQTYPISHVAENIDNLPIHIVGFNEPNHPERNTLDIKTSGGTTRFSPHGILQEYLNVTEHLYGIATNGLYLRLIRDSGLLIKLTYVEFDLKRMLDEDKYSEFTVLYRLIHSSRFPQRKEEADQCLLEKYYQDSIETGNRIRDGLSKAVKESLLALGKGFLQHENNKVLREKIQSGNLSAKNYYRQLLRVIYRLLFLMVTEERDLVYDPEDKSEDIQRLKKIYWKFYSIHRLRKLSESRHVYEAQFSDLWQGLVNTFLLFESSGKGTKLGIQPLDGDLFSYSAIADLQNSLITNKLLLECVRNLNEFTDENKNLVPINYRSLDVEELGSVYEGLLELHPVIENMEATNPAYINFTFHEGTDRKTTGSYYTRPDLVNELIKSALIPVIEERLKNPKNFLSQQEIQKASSAGGGLEGAVLLKLKVCDAASGSGHMVLAAARTIAWYLARVRSGEENPAPSLYRTCLREVIQHCIYAVDMNPDAVELCKLALWLEGHSSGKPLSFLDHKIRCGNSLVGVTDLSVLKNGIPDGAFNPVTGDDKEVCRELKKRNAAFNRTPQLDLFSAQGQQIKKDTDILKTTYAEIEDINQDTVGAVQEVKKRFDKVRTSVFHEEKACHIWTAAFFKTYTDIDDPTNPSSEKLTQYFYAPTQYGRLVGEADKLASKHNFFHWPLEFPDVFEQGGFDVMLGNPPWEKINLEDKEFFETRDKRISSITKSAQRTKAINQLELVNPVLYNEYCDALVKANKTINFYKTSQSFKYGNEGLLNTYPLFTELVVNFINEKGKAGLVVPSGFFGDDTISPLFRFCVKNDFVDSIFDFENTKNIFPSVHKQTRFSLITFGKKNKLPHGFKAKFYLTDPIDIHNKEISRLNFDYSILKKFNPNNLVCPSFKSQFEFDLNKKIFKFGVLKDEEDVENKIEVHRMINMSSDSNLFENEYFEGSLPLYESKLFYLFDHRYSTFEDSSIEDIRTGNAADVSNAQKQNAVFNIVPRYFIDKNIIVDKNEKWGWKNKWYLAYRYISRYTNERTAICSIIPPSVVSNSSYLIFIHVIQDLILQKALINSLVFDFIVRSKVTLNFPPVILFQTPRITGSDINATEKLFIITKALELSYSAWDIKSFADDVWKEADEDLKAAIHNQWEANKAATGGHTWSPPDWCEIDPEGCPLPPFKWDEDRRSILKAELDAIYAKLYGLTTEELRYILDPQDVYGPDFPGETFRVLKEKEIRLYGEYRTRRLVLEAWERLERGEKESSLSYNGEVLSKFKESTINSSTMKEFGLNEGIYSVQDVSRITRLSADKVRRWFKELSDKNYEGLASNQKSDVENMRISFHGLIELVVIGTLRDNGFTLANVLKAKADLQSKSKKIYPFATNNVKLNLKVIPGKGIYFKFPEGLVKLDGTGQYNLNFIFEFFANIEFDIDGIALRLFPLSHSKLVVIDPKIGGGKPSITGKGIYVEMIQRAHQGRNSVESIMDQFDLNAEEINAALEYSLI